MDYLEQENQLYELLGDKYDVHQTIRVLITNSNDDSYNLYSMRLSSDAPMMVSSGTQIITIPADVTWDAGEMLADGETIQVKSLDEHGQIRVESLQKKGNTPIYEGMLEITSRNGAYRLINEVDLETYVKYVVPSEMPSTYPAEALCAQAVCARSYALYQMSQERLKDYGADVDDTVSYQVYAHIPPQKTTTKAVEDTAGQVIAYEGEPIAAYFFSTSCGFTSGSEVWGGKDVPYLRAIALSDTFEQEDTEVFSLHEGILSETAFINHLKNTKTNDLERTELWYRWEVTFPWYEIKSRAYAWYPEIGTLQNLKIVERSKGGAVTKMELQGTAGSKLIETEYSVRQFFAPQTWKVSLQDGSEAPKQKLLPSAYFHYTFRYKDGQVSGLQINGGGYGHGVGLSQAGAKYMAQQGMKWEEIVQRFYENVSIAKIA